MYLFWGSSIDYKVGNFKFSLLPVIWEGITSGLIVFTSDLNKLRDSSSMVLAPTPVMDFKRVNLPILVIYFNISAS